MLGVRFGGVLARKFSTSQAMRSQGATAEAVKLWRNMTYFVALPSVFFVGIYVYLEHTEHQKHHVRPEFVPYDCMYIRTRRFPWGDGNHTLFHNKKVNALPEGYED